MSSKSLTVPNQALTIPQILQRYVNGQAIPTRQVFYDDKTIIPEKNYLDLQTSREHIEFNEERINILQNELEGLKSKSPVKNDVENEETKLKDKVDN